MFDHRLLQRWAVEMETKWEEWPTLWACVEKKGAFALPIGLASQSSRLLESNRKGNAPSEHAHYHFTDPIDSLQLNFFTHISRMHTD